jgi:hypothetical protein
VVEALDFSAVGEGGRRGGRNGRHGAAKLSSMLLQNGGKGSGGSGLRVPTWRGKTGGSGRGWHTIGRPLRPARRRRVQTAADDVE